MKRAWINHVFNPSLSTVLHTVSVCVSLTYPFAGASADRWMCLRRLSDGAHHQLYQRTLLSV